MPSNTLRRGEKWGARVTLHGRQTWLGTFPTREEAQAVADAARGGAEVGGSVGEWFAAWPHLAGARRERSQETIDRTLALAGPFLQAFGGLKLATLTRERCASWALAHPGNMRYARTILSDAVWAGVLRENPLDGVRSGSGSGRPRGGLSEADVGRLAACCEEPLLRALVLVAAYSGLRLSEALALEARDLDGDTLHVRRGKGGKEAFSVLLPMGQAAFRGVAPEVGRLFPAEWDRRSVNREFAKVRKLAGVPTATFHDLRHFHATMLLERGVSRADVAMQLRHSGLRDVDRYLHPTQAPALDRVRAVS